MTRTAGSSRARRGTAGIAGFLLAAVLGPGLGTGCTSNADNEAGLSLTGRSRSLVVPDTLVTIGPDTSWSVDLPLAGSSRLFVGEYSGYEAGLLVRFADLPAGAAVGQATLILQGQSAAVDDSLSPITLRFAPVTCDWDSTWTGADMGLLTLGSVAAERSVLLEAALDTVHIALPPSLVQSWIDASGPAGRGIAVTALSPAPFMLSLYSRDATGSASSRQPRLRLTYVPAGGTAATSQTIYSTADLALVRFTPGAPPPGDLYVGRGAPFRTLLHFDISAIPAGATVNRAVLRLGFAPDRALASALTLAAALPLDPDPWNVHAGPVFQEGTVSYAVSIGVLDTTGAINVTPTVAVGILAGGPVLELLLLASQEVTDIGYLRLRGGASPDRRARLEIVYSQPRGGNR